MTVNAEFPDLKADDRVTVVNETGLPDEVVEEAVAVQWVGQDHFAWGSGSTFQTYSEGGSAFARASFDTPSDVFGEIRLARDMVERDDDVAAAVGWMIACAYEGGMRNDHEDERTRGLFDAIARNANLDHVFAELYREYLISAQVNTVQLFTRKALEYREFAKSEVKSQVVSAPLVGVLPAENMRVLSNDMFGTGELAYVPDSERLRMWLNKYFDPNTSPGVKAKMAREDRVTAAMFRGYRDLGDDGIDDFTNLGWMLDQRVWLLNPRMVHRSTAPKGVAKYPRPFLTRNFGLLEAKRLLNILDWSLLQGGASYIVVAKLGNDTHKAKKSELAGLENAVRSATKAGVMIGDHRLSFEVITPNLEQLLSPQKRRLLGRKLAMAMLRTPEHGTEEPGGEGMKAEQSEQGRIIGFDRRLLRRHVERAVYGEVTKRNPSVFPKGAPSLWQPKIVLGENQFFLDIVKTLGDRGLLSRTTFASIGGFDLEAEMAQRQREKDAGIDELTEVVVPHSSPNAGPQDSGGGRPPGAGNGHKPDPAAPKRTIRQTPGETVKTAVLKGSPVKIGEATERIMAEYPEATLGRVHASERKAVEAGVSAQVGPKVVLVARSDYALTDLRAVNLSDGVRLIAGKRKTDGALMTAGLVFRDEDLNPVDAVARAERWGLDVAGLG